MTPQGRSSSNHVQARAAGGGFDYGLAPVEVREQIQQAVHVVRERLQAAEPNAVAIGREFRTVKRLLAHGTFVSWLEAEFGMAHGEVVRFIAAAEKGSRR